uniref:Putative secreted peptide n=1 Tax=Anopheles braziliensis TaxID=58242 RepID=A0A2M3ZNY5_9DIPT
MMMMMMMMICWTRTVESMRMMRWINTLISWIMWTKQLMLSSVDRTKMVRESGYRPIMQKLEHCIRIARVT